MRETQTKTIGKNVYKVTQLGAKKGRRASFLLVKMLGPAGEALVSSGTVDIEATIGAAFSKMLAGANVEDFEYVCDTLAEASAVVLTAKFNDGDKHIDQPLDKVFDEHFAGNYDELALWFAFAVQVNFSSFLSGNASANALGLLKKLQAKSPSLSPQG